MLREIWEFFFPPKKKVIAEAPVSKSQEPSKWSQRLDEMQKLQAERVNATKSAPVVKKAAPPKPIAKVVTPKNVQRLRKQSIAGTLNTSNIVVYDGVEYYDDGFSLLELIIAEELFFSGDDGYYNTYDEYAQTDGYPQDDFIPEQYVETPVSNYVEPQNDYIPVSDVTDSLPGDNIGYMPSSSNDSTYMERGYTPEPVQSYEPSPSYTPSYETPSYNSDSSSSYDSGSSSSYDSGSSYSYDSGSSSFDSGSSSFDSSSGGGGDW